MYRSMERYFDTVQVPFLTVTVLLPFRSVLIPVHCTVNKKPPMVSSDKEKIKTKAQKLIFTLDKG